MLRETAWAKVNLYLNVVGRRDDGYHLLDSLVVFPDIGDVLSAEHDPEISLSITGPSGAGLTAGADNLVMRAAHSLAAACHVPTGAKIVLEKNLPVASGIGGGSADAAAALRLLCRLWSVSPDPAALAGLAAGLGADVPVCLPSATARMQGIGEILAAAPALPACGMVLVNPGVAVSTPDVFRARRGAFSMVPTTPQSWPNAEVMAADLKRYGNDLEPPALSLCPEIGDALTALRLEAGCLLAQMSGSGATCFGIFSDSSSAIAAAERLKRLSWWVWGGAASHSVMDPGLPDRGWRP